MHPFDCERDHADPGVRIPWGIHPDAFNPLQAVNQSGSKGALVAVDPFHSLCHEILCRNPKANTPGDVRGPRLVFFIPPERDVAVCRD